MTPKSMLFPTMLQVGIQMLSWIIIYKLFSGKIWYDSKFQEIFQIGLVAIGTYIVSIFTFVYRPIYITVTQENTYTSKDETFIDIQDDILKTLQNQRTVNLNLNILRRGSIWWRVLNKILTHYKIYISFYINISSLGLVTDTKNEITPNNKDGFNLYLNDYLLALFNGNGNFPIIENIEYSVFYDEIQHQVISATYHIVPEFLVVRNTNSFLSKIFTPLVKWILQLDIKKHQITIVKR